MVEFYCSELKFVSSTDILETLIKFFSLNFHPEITPLCMRPYLLFTFTCCTCNRPAFHNNIERSYHLRITFGCKLCYILHIHYIFISDLTLYLCMHLFIVSSVFIKIYKYLIIVQVGTKVVLSYVSTNLRSRNVCLACRNSTLLRVHELIRCYSAKYFIRVDFFSEYPQNYDFIIICESCAVVTALSLHRCFYCLIKLKHKCYLIETDKLTSVKTFYG